MSKSRPFLNLYVALLSGTLTWLFSLPTLAAEHKNIALVIANTEYDDHSWAILPNAKRDAKIIIEKLGWAGFEVLTPAVNLKQSALLARLDEFRRKVSLEPLSSVVWIYYAGHAVQINGANFLVPIGAPSIEELMRKASEESQITVESSIAQKLVPLNQLIEVFGNRTTGTQFGANVVILDACRENPLARGPFRKRGLADAPLTANTLIAFSASAGRTAEDGPKDGNSPYAVAFVNALDQAYLPLELLFSSITRGVVLGTTGAQRPEYRTGLAGFYCIKECTLALPPGLADSMEQEQKAHTQGSDLACPQCPEIARVQLPDGHAIDVATTDVTVAMWKKCVDDLACSEPSVKSGGSDDTPVVGISWNDAQKYVVWLTNVSGRRYRLPSSEEWTQAVTLNRPRLRSSAPEHVVAGGGVTDQLSLDQGVAEWTSSCDTPSAADGRCDTKIVRGRSWRDHDADPMQLHRFNSAARGDAIGFRLIAQ